MVPNSDWGSVCLSCLKGGLTVPSVAAVLEFGLTATRTSEEARNT